MPPESNGQGALLRALLPAVAAAPTFSQYSYILLDLVMIISGTRRFLKAIGTDFVGPFALSLAEKLLVPVMPHSIVLQWRLSAP